MHTPTRKSFGFMHGVFVEPNSTQSEWKIIKLVTPEGFEECRKIALVWDQLPDHSCNLDHLETL